MCAGGASLVGGNEQARTSHIEEKCPPERTFVLALKPEADVGGGSAGAECSDLLLTAKTTEERQRWINALSAALGSDVVTTAASKQTGGASAPLPAATATLEDSDDDTI
eukprot:COSAG05_NODE_503_length_9211_cov_44.051361_6_plen_109_part_00